MKRILWSLLILMTLVISGCGVGGKINGADTGGGGSTPSGVAALDLSPTKLTLDTNGTDKIDFTVYAKDAQNAAATEKTITVASTGGFLTTSILTTDANGLATFSLGVSSEKTNRQIVVTLTAGTVIKTQSITISGTTLTVTATKIITTPNDLAPIVLTATLKDAGGQPISGAMINLSSLLGNTFVAEPDYAFATGTDSAGVFKVRYTGDNTGADTVTVTSSGATDSVDVTSNPASNFSFDFTSPADLTVVPVSTDQPLTVEWINADGTPAANEVLTFVAGKGTFAASGTIMTTATTDVSGSVTVMYNTGATAGPASITVSDSTNTQSATLTLGVVSTSPTSINLQVNPGVIPVSTETTTSTATLKATVRDVNNQAVAGMLVGFGIQQGPGAGEFIFPVTALTDNGGIATSTFTSGSGSSPQNGVVIAATVSGVAIPATATMTIAKNAATISIGSTNKIEKVEPVGYKQPFTVLVTNSSGAAVEGQSVALSLAPIRFYTGVGGDAIVRTGVYVAEDTNRNYVLDVGEDCAIQLDFYTRIATGKYWQDGGEGMPATIAPSLATCAGNDRIDPGGVATIDPPVTTGADGMATFYIHYPKSSGAWVDVEVTASADVSGTNASAKVEAPLKVEDGDTPFLWSPFGYEPLPPAP